jgi:hypothetical protein
LPVEIFSREHPKVSSMSRNPKEPTEVPATDTALNHSSRVSRPSRFTRLARGLAVIAAGVVLFYAAAGYFGSAGMFGNHPRWHGMNRGPADFGLRSETVSFDSTDGIPLKAWWLPASGMPRGAVIEGVSEDISHHSLHDTRTNFWVRAMFLISSFPSVARATRR